MAVTAIDVTLGTNATPFMQRLQADLTQFRAYRESVLRDFAALDQMRDAGTITIFLAGKVGTNGADNAAKIAEAQKLYDELNSLQGYISSEAANTLGAAILQICAKLGI